jgi:anti-sigma-K factor RskA
MTCQQVQKLLPDYSVGRLGPRRQEALARHLATCATCAQEWAAMQGSLALLERLDRAEPPAGLWAQIEARLTPERPRPFWRAWPQRWLGQPWRRAPALAAALAVVAVAVVLFLRPSPPAAPPARPTPTAFVGNSFVQQYATLASYEPLADRAALGAVATLARRGEQGGRANERRGE